MIFAIAITLAVNVPIDNQIKIWTTTSLPPDWTQVRDRWETFHTGRTFLSLTALASVLLALLRR
jgi:hypothetical protein